MNRVIGNVAKTLVLALALAMSPAIGANALTPPVGVNVSTNSDPGTAIDAASAKVTWTSVTGAVAYAVFAQLGSETIAGSTPSCQGNECVSFLSDLTGGEDYSVVVSSIDAEGGSSASTPVSHTAISVPTGPRAPIAEASDGQIVLRWSEPSILGGLSLLDYSITDGGANTLTAASEATSATFSGLTNGNSYTFTIKARNSNGFSATVSFTATTPVGAPATPGRPTMTSTSDSVTTTWVAPNNGGSAITGYSVQLFKSGSLVQTLPALSTLRSITFGGLGVGSYTAKVIAQNASGSSDPSPASLAIAVGSVLLDQQITFPAIGEQTFPGGITLSASVDSPLPLGLTATGQCSVVPATKRVTFTSTGSCTITAAQAGNASYAAATSVTRTFSILLAGADPSRAPAVAGQGGSPSTSSATTSPTSSLTVSQTVSPSVSPQSTSSKKITIGTFQGYIAIYLKGYEGERVSFLVAGKWGLVKKVDKDFYRIIRNTGSGYSIRTKVFVNKILLQEKALVTR